ncbi:MAG: hypothetical protein ACR2QO_04505 [Acidimicrobiales bacterium]
MARRELVRRLNLELPAAERPDYDAETVNGLVDWICEAETLPEQRNRITDVLGRLRLRGTDG